MAFRKRKHFLEVCHEKNVLHQFTPILRRKSYANPVNSLPEANAIGR